MADRCELCGGRVRAVSSDEGTNHYVSVEAEKLADLAKAVRHYFAEEDTGDGARWQYALHALLALVEAAEEAEE